MTMPDNKNSDVNDDNITRNHSQVLGRQDSEVDESIDDDLPSVNRHRGRNKLFDIVGFGSILGLGIAMMYFVNSEDAPKVEAPKQLGIVNALPPLEIPEPPRPEPLAPPEPPAHIPVQKQSQAPNGPAQPSWSDRKMTGMHVIKAGGNSGSSQSDEQVAAGTVTENLDTPTPLALRLKSTTAQGVSAAMLPDRNYLITKGTSLDCALETAIDSTVPGITTCRLTRDIYSDNGHVVLLDRGSQLIGEYQGGITAGQVRIFVLWTRAKTPNGVVVTLDSPGADTLGRSGHSGWVDRHFMERFGASIMMSLVKDTLAIARNQNQTQFQIGGGGTDQLAVEILKETAKIPPTLYINQGDHIQIMVARDLDFSSVYGLKLKD